MLRLQVVTPPAEVDRLAVSFDEIEAYLRIRGVNQMPDIKMLVAASQVEVEQLIGPVVETTLDAYAGSFAGQVCYLPATMVTEVVSVNYRPAAGGAEQLLDQANWTASLPDPALPSFPPSIQLASGKSWPATACTPVAVRIRYRAGWPAGQAPEMVKAAILASAAFHDRTRDGYDGVNSAIGRSAWTESKVGHLLVNYRHRRNGWE